MSAVPHLRLVEATVEEESVDSRIPPFDLDAEAAMLSAILFDPVALDQVADLAKPEHMYSEAHRRIYEAILAVRDEGLAIDPVVVMSWLRQHDRLAQAGGAAYLTTILNHAPATANWASYASIVVDCAVIRRALAICQKHVALGYAQPESAAEYLNSIASDIQELSNEDQRSSGEMIGPLLEESIKRVSDAVNAGRGYTGLETGFDRLDRLTGGLHAGDLTIVAGRPGMGKSALGLNIATNVAMAKEPLGAIVFTLEMPREQLSSRLLCSEGRIDLARFRTGMLSPTDWPRLQATSVALNKAPIWIDDKPNMTLVELRARARRYMAQAEKKKRKVGLIVVDYLQLMRGPGRSREEEIGGISRGLKALAKELALPVLALAQVNRKNEDRTDKRPQLSDLRESGAIEQDADNVVFVYRDELYDKNTADRNIAELKVAKQRNGPADTVRVRFDAQYTRFDNLADGEFEEAS